MSFVAAHPPVEKWRGALVPLLLILVAEAAFHIVTVKSDALAAPSAVVMSWAGAIADGSLLSATLATLAAATAGLGVGWALGLFLGLAFGSIALLDRMFNLTVEAVRPVPSIALVPIALLIFGFGYRLEIAVVAFAVMWPVMILSRAAIRGIEPCLKEVARALRLSFTARLKGIVIPAILPQLFVALRISFGIALVVAVTVEISANPIGLGSGIMQAQQTLRPELMLTYLAWIGLIGLVLNAGLLRLETSIFRKRRGGHD